MGLQSKLGIEHKGMFFFALFYLITGVMNLMILGMNELEPPHIALVAFVSLITAFGLYRLQQWSLWLVVGLFFISTTYAAITLNTVLTIYSTSPEASNLLAIVALTAYLILTWIATIYVAAKRKNLK